MSSKVEYNNDEVMTVDAFAAKYRVDASVVRAWIKAGYINWTLCGPRKMKRIARADAVKPLIPTNGRGRVVHYLIQAQQLDRDVAVSMVDSMADADLVPLKAEAEEYFNGKA